MKFRKKGIGWRGPHSRTPDDAPRRFDNEPLRGALRKIGDDKIAEMVIRTLATMCCFLI